MATRCGHCGREGTLTDGGHAEMDSHEVKVRDADNTIVDVVDERDMAWAQKCTACRGVTVSRYRWADSWLEEDTPVVVYPPGRSADDLPADVEKRYVKMLEYRHDPDVFAVQAGRTLEAICADRGLSNKVGNLEARLDRLVNEELVPQPMVDQAHLVRRYRNIGGHDEVIDVEEEDVPLIQGFVDALLSYLYRDPAKLARATASLEERKAQAKSAS
jgi:hypothetical protein